MFVTWLIWVVIICYLLVSWCILKNMYHMHTVIKEGHESQVMEREFWEKWTGQPMATQNTTGGSYGGTRLWVQPLGGESIKIRSPWLPSKFKANPDYRKFWSWNGKENKSINIASENLNKTNHFWRREQNRGRSEKQTSWCVSHRYHLPVEKVPFLSSASGVMGH